MIENAVKKGDIVVVSLTRSVTYGFGSGRGTERTTFFTFAKINTASRNGEARTVLRRSGAVDKVSPFNVMTIPSKYAAAAQRVFAGLTWDTDEFADKSAIKSALLKA